MPSMMIHLLTAYKLEALKDTLFCIGTVAPDAVKGREEKDITHFRTEKNREKALIDLACKSDRENSFSEGILSHLYLDWLWDNQAYSEYAKNHKGNDWFYCYRDEIAKAGSFVFRNYSWSDEVFLRMVDCPIKLYGTTPGTTSQIVFEMIKRNYLWNKDRNIGPSYVFTPEYVEEFTSNAAKSYKKWRNRIKVKTHKNMGA